jgi:phosphoenolpyruvate carboxykinase (ATP)
MKFYLHQLLKKELVDRHHLDLVELMLADQPARVAPGGTGSRFPIPVTRAVVKAAQEGMLVGAETRHIASLNLDFPVSIPGVDPQYVDPKAGWGDDDAYEAQAGQLATLFLENIAQFDVSDAIVAAGPKAQWAKG